MKVTLLWTPVPSHCACTVVLEAERSPSLKALCPSQHLTGKYTSSMGSPIIALREWLLPAEHSEVVYLLPVGIIPATCGYYTCYLWVYLVDHSMRPEQRVTGGQVHCIHLGNLHFSTFHELVLSI